MISANEFTKQSLALHLFFARIMKEHSFFLQVGFTSKDYNLISQANTFRTDFDSLLRETIALSNGVVDPAVLLSGEVVTPYTLKAEMLSAGYTGVNIPVQLTQAESSLQGNPRSIDSQYEQMVVELNDYAIGLISSLIKFKTNILSNVLTCNLFSVNYPLLIDHILREAKLYLKMIQRIQRRESFNIEKEELEQEAFWNRIMAEHSKFIRGLLDPTENDLINVANNFGNEFDQLTQEAIEAMNRTNSISKVTEDSLAATKKIKDFNTQGTQGLIDCKIKSIIIPLLGDHVLRESNHYLRLLNMFKQGSRV